MGRLVKANPAADTSKSQTTVVGTGAHGRLVRTGDVQRTSPAGNAAQQPTIYQKALDAAMERANEKDKLTTPSARRQERADEADKNTTPSASRQAKQQSFGQRALKAAGSGIVSEGANLANLGGVVADQRGGTEMSGVYRRQAEALDKQIAALEKTLQDPTMTAQDIKETNDALAIARSERAKYGKVIESGEKTGKGLYETADKGYSLAQKLSDESLSGTKGIQKGVLRIIPAATQIGAQTAERMIAPGLDMVGRAASVAGANAANYRHKAGTQYDVEKASLRATVAALGVAAGGALSKGVNAAGLKLLRAAGAQNRVLPNILLGGTSAVGYAAGETGASELSKAMTDENYTPDWNAIGETALTAFTFGAVTSTINAAAITGRNKRYMNELNDAAKERYNYAKRIIEDPRATAEQKAAGAQSVMDAVDKLRYTLDDLQVVGAQKEVDAMREFLLSIYGEMLPYTNTSAGGIGTGTSAIAPTAPGGGIAIARAGEAAATAPENTTSAPISSRAPGAAAVQQQPAAAPENAPQQVTGKLESTASGQAAHIKMEDFTNTESRAFTNVPYDDIDTQQKITGRVHQEMVTSGQIVKIPESEAAKVSGYYPDMRGMKKSERTPILRQKMAEVKAFLRAGLESLKDVNYEFDVNGNVLDARLYNTGIREVLEKVTRQKAAMLTQSDAIFRNAQYLYSTPDYDGNPNVYRWNYFYSPVEVGGETVGVRIAIRDMAKGTNLTPESQIYNWGIKKAPLDGESRDQKAASLDVSSGTILDSTVPQGNSDVKEQGMQNGAEYAQAAEADNNMTGVENDAGPQTQHEPGGAESAEAGGQRADAVAAQDDLYGGDRGRGAAELGTGGTGKLRRTTEESQRNRALIQQRRERAWQQPVTSAAALGVQGGTSEETLHVLPENEWDEELRGFSDWARGKGVKRVTMVTGLMQVETENGAVGVRGVINRESGEMVLRVDNDRHGAAEIGKHEVGHFITEEENVRAFMDAVRGGGRDWQGIYDAYEERYASLTANYIGMTAEQRALYVWEEILEDAYAELDSYGQQASRYHAQAVSAIENAAEAPDFARSEPEGLRLRAVDEPRSRGPPERYSYAGKNAANANHEARYEAERLEMQGVDAETIRQMTGWFRGADRKWRFETDDSSMKLRMNAADIPNYTTLGKLVDAPELFTAYPDLKNIDVTLQTLEDGQNGGYNRQFDSIALSRSLKEKPEELLNSLIHEVQHAIQNREEFAKGANPAYWNRKLENGYDGRTAEAKREGAKLQEQYDAMKENDPQFIADMEELNAMAPTVPRGKIDFNTLEQIEPDPPEWERFDARRDQLEEQYGDRVWDYFSLRDSIDRNKKYGDRMPSDLYRDTAGEIEARDTAARRSLSAEERRNRRPDTGNEDTVFADGGGNYFAMSADEQAGIREQLRKHQDELNMMKPVGTVNSHSYAGLDTRSVREKIVNDLKKTGYKVDRPDIGVIQFYEREINNSLNYKEKDPSAEDARRTGFLVLKDVLKRGIEISGHSDHKGRGYETLTIAAPVEINGKRGNMAVVVKQTKGNRYKIHRILTPEGGTFTMPETANAEMNTVGAVTNNSQSLGGSAPAISSASDNSIPRSGGNVKPKQRFSMEEPVEETKTLIAMHNMTEEKLRRTLDLGAWPSPSIAIVKAKDGHNNYGEYSAIFPRETIDPQADSRNHVYGGDAWTPTHDNALVEREVNYATRRAFDSRIEDLSSQFAGGIFHGSSTLGKIGLENETRWEPGEIAEKLANYPEVQAAYLQSKGESLEPERRSKRFDRNYSNATIQRYLDSVGAQEVARLNVKLLTGGHLTEKEAAQAEKAIREVYSEEHANFLNRRPESKEKRIDYYMQNNVTRNRVEDFVRSAEAFYESGGSANEPDKEATAAKMFEMIAPGGSQGDALRVVKDWVQPQLDGLLGERGVYNGKDAVTDSGRRSFAETHWDYTAENIVKAMNMASDKGANMYGVTPETLAATATPEFRSVDEMHAGEDRLRTEDQDAHDKALRDLGIELDRAVDDLMRTTKHRHSNTFDEEQALSGIIAEAAKGKRTASAVKTAFRKEGYTISDGHAASILRLIERAASIPTGYYEAKPQRVVPFMESVAVVAPDNAPADLLSEMRTAGMNVIEYAAGDDADRLEKINSIKDIRFSAEDADGGDTWSEELAQMPQNVQEAVQRAKERRDNGKKQGLQEFPNLDAYLSGKSAQQAAERAEKLRNKSKDEFDGTEALKNLGIKIENSAGDYSNVKQLIENDRAAKAIRRETQKAIQRLGATPKEQNFALNIASGLYDESDIPPTMNRGKVEELADYYSAEQSMSSDFIRQRRAEINETLEEKMKDLFDERFEGEFTAKTTKKGIAPDSGFALYHRTPQRSMRAIFGWERGQEINEAIFEPVYTNEQERKRFINRMHDEVRTFKDKDGKESALTERERALTQLVIEGKAVDEMVGKSELKQQIIHAAENLLNGAEMKEAAQEFGLHGKDERELAQRYADWLRTKEELRSGNVDRVKIENAAAEYSRLYDKFYAAINDFLAAHGYEPIGFIKGYAPHFQPEAESTKLESALKAIGVDLGAEVGKLPASIAGLTKSFKPNKRYNPFFQHRKGDSTEYDVQKGFEKYVDYLSDVLYHTDDIMRTRAAAKYFRKKYAPDEISAQIEQAENLRYATPEEKELFLKTNGIIDRDARLSYEGMNKAMEEYTEGLFGDVQQTTKYGDLVTWLDDYANKLAGKQLFNDRSMEREVGRTSLNVGRKMVNLFARANVAGNLSSALNQTAQLPMILGELGPKYVAEAVGDIIKGETKGDFAERSDFLTEKHGIDYLTSKKGDKVMEALFWPLERMDYLVSSIAVRGKYRKELAEGKSEEDALRAADRWGRDMMGSRSKGTAPLTFQSKNLVSQMVNLFQVEALNSWEHVTQDLFGPGLKEMEAKLGKKEAARRLAGTIIGTLLGAFLLNRLDEELYGGTPAQFDVLGLLTGFLASGNGLSTNEQLGVWIDDVWQKMTGERLFGTDEDAGNDQFNLAAAAEDTLYNVSNDVPYVRNVSGLLGLGDQTLPMPDLYGTAKGIGGSLSKAASGDYDSAADFWGEVGKQIMGLAGDTLPGGRQAEKTMQGTETLLRGGTYSGYGDDARLQYPVTPSFSTVLQSTMFGRNALSESRDYYAAGMGALSVKQTQVYRELVEMGADQQTVYDAIQDWRRIDKDKSLSDGEREAARYELVSKLTLTNEQKAKLHDELANSSKGYAAAQEAEQQGISMDTYAEYKDATADLKADKDENGNSISGSKKQKVIEEINKMPVNAHQKDWLYLREGYSQKDLKKMPWNQ